MNNAQATAEDSETDDDASTESRASQSRRSGNRNRRNNNNNNDSPGVEWNATQRAYGFYQITTELPLEQTQHHQVIKAQLDLAQQLKQIENYDNILFADTGSSVTTIFNEKLLSNIRMSKRPILMQTNIGSKRIVLEGDMAG